MTKTAPLPLIIVFCSFLLGICDLHAERSHQRVSGVDISHFNGTVNWKMLTQTKMNFVVLKATEGIDWVDPTFAESWAEAGKHGLIRGAYHFFVAHDDPQQEAGWYIQNVSLQPGDLPPIVDVERAQKKFVSKLSKRLKDFVKHIEKHYGAKPIIYTGPNFWNKNVKDAFSDHHLWVADYGVEKPVVPGKWKRWTFWQYTQDAILEGVEKPVDLNTFSGSHSDLKQMLLK